MMPAATPAPTQRISSPPRDLSKLTPSAIPPPANSQAIEWKVIALRVLSSDASRLNRALARTSTKPPIAASAPPNSAPVSRDKPATRTDLC